MEGAARLAMLNGTAPRGEKAANKRPQRGDVWMPG